MLTLGALAMTVAAAYGVAAGAVRPRLTAQSAPRPGSPPSIVAWDVATTVWTTPPPALSSETPVLTASPVPTTLPSASAPPSRRVISSPPPAPRSRLISADGRLDAAVGVYSDCSGASALPRYEAAIDTCISDRTYFVGHSPGAFSPLLGENVGAIIDWWDGAGTMHALRIVARRDWTRGSGAPAPPVSSAVVAQFQTCLDSTGSQELILDATPA